MQGQRNSVEQLSDVFGFDHGSGSGNPVMDQQAYWNSMLGAAESQNLPGYEMNRGDGAIPYGSEAHQDGQFLGFWGSGEASSSGSALNYGSSNAIKAEHLNIGGGLRIGERRLGAEHNLSLDNVDINLNTSGHDLFGQSSNANNASQASQQHAGCSRTDATAQATELRLHPYRTFGLDDEQPEPFPSLNAFEHPLGNFSLMPEDIDQRPGSSSLDGRRLACKRKNIEGVHGQFSAGASTSFSHRNDNAFHSVPSSSFNPAPGPNVSSHNFLLAPSSIEEQLPNYGATTIMSSVSYNHPSGGNNSSGNSQRSFRARTTTAQQSAFDELEAAMPVVSGINLQYQHPGNVVPGIPQTAHRFAGHGASSSRAGSLDNIILGREEVTGRNLVAPGFPSAAPHAALDMRHLVPELSNWNSDNPGATIPGNVSSVSRANASSTISRPAGSTSLTHQNLHRRHPRNLSEEIGRLSGALRGPQHPRLRSGFLLERQGDGVWGVPLPMRNTREGRRLMEIRNALEMIQRGENVRFESIFYGGVEIHDRHRDMRLDIDNMSYEELLALEERIGNVNTGLTENDVMKLLKQRKFSSWRLSSVEYEPCCICQEEYVDGDDLGTLHCGHDFHASCIRQWLVVKNLCPICKSTALKT
ncbi:unnamed protein product [Triticum turgidum subsp. durum]|uniref:RING-type E3 ubiquitin transferase n=1 Tax=Triticum turgidum subsp. durum TaxID=4567 RepID=A0A9R1P7W0_TRITD|nr:unnamed protein product [Triticum turgidum subsp. durum]